MANKFLDQNGLLYTLQKVKGTFVEKETGKGLSTNDYTDAEKTKLDGIAAGAEVNVQSDWNATSGDALILNKPSIPSKTSDLTNDSGFITSSAIPAASSTTPKMNGTAAVGTETTFARGDHVHPSDTTRVPTSRKVNGKALSADITISAADVSAVPTTRTVNSKALSEDITLSAADVGAAASVHTHDAATTTAAGFMSDTDKVKLDGIAAGANKYVHPSYTAKTSGLYKVTVDATGHVSGTAAVTKADITGLGIPAQDTTYSDMTGATDSSAGISGLVPAPAAGKQTSFLRGDGTWVVPTDTTYSNATTSAAGLMSAADKTKLDGIATGANKTTIVNNLTTTTTGSALDAAQGKVLNDAIAGKADASHTHSNYVPTTRTVNGKALSSNITLSASDVGAIATTARGTANGVASLDEDGKVPSTQLPSYVDDIIEGYLYNAKFYKESTHKTEIAGESGKIYVDLDTNYSYRYGGSTFVLITSADMVALTNEEIEGIWASA